MATGKPCLLLTKNSSTGIRVLEVHTRSYELMNEVETLYKDMIQLKLLKTMKANPRMLKTWNWIMTRDSVYEFRRFENLIRYFSLDESLFRRWSGRWWVKINRIIIFELFEFFTRRFTNACYALVINQFFSVEKVIYDCHCQTFVKWSLFYHFKIVLYNLYYY